MCTRFVYNGKETIVGFNFDIDLSEWEQSAGVDGVGIGLYLTRDIVNKQNGYIKVASDEKGTIFSLFLKKV